LKCPPVLSFCLLKGTFERVQSIPLLTGDEGGSEFECEQVERKVPRRNQAGDAKWRPDGVIDDSSFIQTVGTFQKMLKKWRLFKEDIFTLFLNF
jgi:hypothetical protein